MVVKDPETGIMDKMKNKQDKRKLIEYGAEPPALMERTKLLLEFFKEHLMFKDNEILYCTESEVLHIEQWINQSRIFKMFIPEVTSTKLKKFAEEIFVNTDRCLNAN